MKTPDSNPAGSRVLPAVPDGRRPRPADPEMERAVLSAMLREPEPCVDIAVSVFGKDPDVFDSQIHRNIFRAILEISATPQNKVDLITVARQLQVMGKYEEVGASTLGELYSVVATTANMEAWSRALRELYTLRRMIGVCQESLLRCYAPDASATTLVESIETAVYNIRNTEGKNSYLTFRECLSREMEYLKKVMTGTLEVGISTGYQKLDDYTGGLKPGEMFVLAARPSIGKTAMALNIVRNIVFPSRSARPRKVAFFSLEMTAEQIARRLLCTEAQISERMLWRREVSPAIIARIKEVVKDIGNAKLFIDPTPGLSVAELRAKARRLHMTKDTDGTPMIDLVVIDYLQLMHADVGKESRQNEVAAISGGLKALAKDLNIPVLVLAQLNRDIDKNSNPDALPQLSHLRESGAIEQDADIVAFLHRKRDEAKDLPDDQSVDAKLIVEKNRNGRTGIVPLLFFPSRMEFTAASPYTDENAPK